MGGGANIPFMSEQGDLLHVVTDDQISAARARVGFWMVWGSAAVMLAVFVALGLVEAGVLN